MAKKEFLLELEKHLDENRVLSGSRGLPKVFGRLAQLLGLEFYKPALVLSFALSLWVFVLFEDRLVDLVKVLLLL